MQALTGEFQDTTDDGLSFYSLFAVITQAAEFRFFIPQCLIYFSESTDNLQF